MHRSLQITTASVVRCEQHTDATLSMRLITADRAGLLSLVLDDRL